MLKASKEKGQVQDHTKKCVHTHACMHSTHTHAHTLTHTHPHTHTHTHTHKHTHTHVIGTGKNKRAALSTYICYLMFTVVELYPGWCGPSKAIQSTFRRIYFDAGDRPLKFFTVGGARQALSTYKGAGS